MKKKDILQNKVSDALKEYFSPEFLNRIDDIIIFNKLSHDNICKIASIMLDELKENTAKRNAVIFILFFILFFVPP